MNTVYTNGVIYTAEEKQQGKAIIVRDNFITGIVDEQNIPEGYAVKDLHGFNIAPAFIDLQIYGGDGKLFSADLDVDSIHATYQYCLRGGCTHFMITIATNTMDVFFKGIGLVREYWQQGGKGCLGLHLEGPYLNPAKKGAHLQSCIKKPHGEGIQAEKGKDVIQMMTVAPEMCDDEIIKLLMDSNIIVSAGHSNATYTGATQKFNLGIPTATHLFNAMFQFGSREPETVALFTTAIVLKQAL